MGLVNHDTGTTNHEPYSPRHRGDEPVLADGATTEPLVIQGALAVPEVHARVYALADTVLNGPFGNFVHVPFPSQHNVKSPNHGEGYTEGFEHGFDAGHETALTSVLEAVNTLINDGGDLEDLAAVIEDVLGEEEPTDPLMDLLQTVFGPNVTILSIEPQ